MKKNPAAKTIIVDEAADLYRKVFPPTLPAIRLRPGTWVAMDSNGCFWQYIGRKMKDDVSWFSPKGTIGRLSANQFLLPKVKHWYKQYWIVGRSGELIRVEVE